MTLVGPPDWAISQFPTVRPIFPSISFTIFRFYLSNKKCIRILLIMVASRTELQV